VGALVTEPKAQLRVYGMMGVSSDESNHTFAGRFAGESRNLPEIPLYARFGRLSMIIFDSPANLPANYGLGDHHEPTSGVIAGLSDGCADAVTAG
jgi:hypothetical protein